jgi:hypothetical protein
MTSVARVGAFYIQTEAILRLQVSIREEKQYLWINNTLFHSHTGGNKLEDTALST